MTKKEKAAERLKVKADQTQIARRKALARHAVVLAKKYVKEGGGKAHANGSNTNELCSKFGGDRLENFNIFLVAVQQQAHLLGMIFRYSNERISISIN